MVSLQVDMVVLACDGALTGINAKAEPQVEVT